MENLAAKIPLLYCPNQSCSQHRACATPSFQKRGRFFRASDAAWVLRFRCKACQKNFSKATFSWNYRLKRRDLAQVLPQDLVSGVSLRRAALKHAAARDTIGRHFLRLSALAAQMNLALREFYKKSSDTFKEVQFDEMESAVQSKMKPVSIPMVVDRASRQVLAFDVVSMPAKGLLAEQARQKYGYRPDERTQAAKKLWASLVGVVDEQALICTDQKSAYPGWISESHPQATHKRYKGERGCIAGQGELKKTQYDPLFAFNHTAAMLRANINRLFRRTWCLSKKIENLKAHIELYVLYHNYVFTKPFQKAAKTSSP